MTGLAKIGLLTVGVGAPSAAGIYYLVGHMSQPGTFADRLLSESRTQLSEGDNGGWGAKFLDYGEKIKSKITTIASTDNPDDAAMRALSSWCKTESSRSAGDGGYGDYVLLCSSSGFKTNRGRLMASGADIASAENDWKLVYLNSKHSQALRDGIKSGVGIDITDDNGPDKLREACTKWLAEESPFTNHELARKWCVKSKAKKVLDLLSTLREFEKMGEDDYSGVDTKWSGNSNYPSILGSITTGSDNAGKMKSYCRSQYEKDLIGLNGNYDSELKNTFNFCNKLSKGGADLQEILWMSN